MTAKRSINSFMSVGSGDTTMNKRLKRVEAAARLNRSEMHHTTWTSSGAVATGSLTSIGITNMSTGNTISLRNGQRIRVWRVEVRGTADVRLDHYLIQSNTATNPVAADFTSGQGAFIQDTDLNTRFTEWRHYRNNSSSGGDDTVKFIHKFPKGIIVKYDGTNSPPVDNGLSYCCLNRTSVGVQNNVSIRVWFTHE